jgi:pimeloyl-ACP methyl ester carboxylesterase
MRETLPVVLVPALLASARLYADQVPALWRYGPVTIADHTRHDTMAVIAQQILAAAPPHFMLMGLSMGGYIAFEIMRQAPERVVKLALMDTAATPETDQARERRESQMAIVEEGRFSEIPDLLYPLMVHKSRHDDAALKATVTKMADEVGAEAFVRQQKAIMHRADSRPLLSSIRCPTLVLVGDGDELTPPERAREIAGGIADAHLVVVPECGHLSTLERPDAVNAALVEWIED